MLWKGRGVFVVGLFSEILIPDKGWIMRNHSFVVDKNSKGI